MTTETQTSTFALLPFMRQADSTDIVIRRASGEYEIPMAGLIKPEMYGMSGNLFKWRAWLILDDERVEFEAESFYDYRIPRVWTERGYEFDLVVEPDAKKLLEACFPDE